MFPVSFAPMVLKWVLPEIREILVPLFKYKDEPNDADIKLIVQGKELESQGREIKALKEMVIELGKESHPPVIDTKEWEDVKKTIKLIKNKRVFKSLNAK